MDENKSDLLGQMFMNLQQMQCDVSKINSNTDPSAELEKIASDKGFVISDNEGSGNCMFHALSEQLNLVKGINILHGELRQSIVQYLLNNPRLLDGTDLFNFIDGYQSWADYLTNMEQDGTWGDHMILYATANCYKTCIHVISSQSNHRDLTIRPDDHVISTNPLVLGHVHEVHYVSLRPKQGSSGHGRPPSSLEHNQSPFLAGTQTPVQTYQTSHPQSFSGYDRPPSLLEHKTGPQTPVQTCKTSHPQSEWEKLFLSLNNSKSNMSTTLQEVDDLH
ncbi:uncharacterized protein LOC110050928 isoform X2 [Orbicella faveolata]|uniref:uncharacterized protein LOC110050928 isoform X2 n=1 Tax=Orbicella faveolata TaxID=48498 RepID=UPI0009E1D244|nr:uncharacterized protein LOC110050928 isoform X2 [Orbicella faveolata]